MAPPNLQHRRTHNLLLISKLLSSRDSVSPFTLLIDNLEQSGKPVLREYIRRAAAAKIEVIFVAFETLKRPKDVAHFVSAWKDGIDKAWKEVGGLIAEASRAGQRKLIILDNLNTLSSHPTTASNLPTHLSGFLSPTTSLLALYHTDIPLPNPSPYTPHPLTLLKYLATTILKTHSLSQILAAKAARERSVAAPSFGLEESLEGVVVGKGANGGAGVVLEMEYRRKSGRGVREWYFLSSSPSPSSPSSSSSSKKKKDFWDGVCLLEDHPDYNKPKLDEEAEGEAEFETTFDLGLTQRQRVAREGVVLPYFDAQKENGVGEGGRILYDMGVEDDFDEEEDEI